MLVVILVRVLGSSLILKYPLFGGLLAIFLDFFDFRLFQYLQGGDISNYQTVDKLLDLYYLSLEAYVVYRWKDNVARICALFLFGYRLIGTIVFELTQVESTLVLFPNIFEYFYLSYLILQKVVKKEIKLRYLVVLILLLTLIKIPHEYLLHVNKTYPWSMNVYVQIFDPHLIGRAAANTVNEIAP